MAASVDNAVVVFTRDSNAQNLFADGFEKTGETGARKGARFCSDSKGGDFGPV